jgi:hypothetical protein
VRRSLSKRIGMKNKNDRDYDDSTADLCSPLRVSWLVNRLPAWNSAFAQNGLLESLDPCSPEIR